MSITQGRIDVHHHLLPPAFAQAMERNGLREVAGAPLPEWTPDRSLDVMDASGIQTAILSLSPPGVFFGDVEQARDLARACNEYAADLRVRNPGRIGWFATLPLPFTAPACAEAGYALDRLDADGVVLLGSAGGRFLGDPAYEDLMAELDARRAVAFLHPNLHATSQALGLDVPGFLLELPCDTTRAAVNLILTGTVERYPRVRWILAHAGGFLPYVAWRASLTNAVPEFGERAPEGVLTYVRRFYYETALAPSACSMAALRELVEPSHILFGSDYPFAPPPIVALECQTLERATGWPDAVKYGIDRGHALRLFPQYRGEGEVVTPAPIYRSESPRGRARRAMAKPLAALAERMRNR
jgi:predicted TIM-barrel fold metal-dependent hydrolase